MGAGQASKAATFLSISVGWSWGQVGLGQVSAAKGMQDIQDRVWDTSVWVGLQHLLVRIKIVGRLCQASLKHLPVHTKLEAGNIPGRGTLKTRLLGYSSHW